jgi:hypothetical protein
VGQRDASRIPCASVSRLPLFQDRAHVLEQNKQVVRVGGSRHKTKPLVERARVMFPLVCLDPTLKSSRLGQAVGNPITSLCNDVRASCWCDRTCFGPSRALRCSDGTVHLPVNIAAEAEFLMVEFNDRSTFQK